MKKCPECGEEYDAMYLPHSCKETQKEPNKEEGKEKKQSNGCLVVFLVIFLIFVGVIWLSYGTLNPCEILKKDAKHIVSEEMGKISKSDNAWEQLGLTIGYGLGMNLVDQAVDGLSPIQCLKGVVKLKFEGIYKKQEVAEEISDILNKSTTKSVSPELAEKDCAMAKIIKKGYTDGLECLYNSKNPICQDAKRYNAEIDARNDCTPDSYIKYIRKFE